MQSVFLIVFDEVHGIILLLFILVLIYSFVFVCFSFIFTGAVFLILFQVLFPQAEFVATSEAYAQLLLWSTQLSKPVIV